MELEKSARFEDVETAVCSDPLFLGEETLVFRVDSVATLEDENHGVLMERRGMAGHTPHQLLLLEARFSEAALCAQCMLAAARDPPTCKAGGYSLFDLPPGALWGRLRAQAERDWL